MKLVELSGVKGGAVWVNPAWIIHLGAVEGGGGSMYGDNNVRAFTRLQFIHGQTLEVKEDAAEVVARLASEAAKLE